MATAKELANVVAEQLAGGIGQLVAMVGARDLVAIENGLVFKFMRTERTKANVCRVKLDHATDTYTVEFCRLRGLDCTTLDTTAGLYAEDLKGHFETYTGLVLTMPRVFRRVAV